MATTVNARDVILQAAPTRVMPVGLPANVVVPTGQVEGLEALSSSSKVIFVKSTSLAFQIPKNGGAVSPASIDLSAVLRNITGTVNWVLVSGTATLGTNANGSKSLAYSSMSTDTVTFRAEVTEGGTTYSDTVTIVKLREGSDTINAILSNETHSIPADSNGNYVTLSGASTSMSIYVGITDTSGSWAFTRSDSAGVTSSISGNTVTVTNMTAGTASGYIDITATRAGYSPITRRMSLTKIKAGSNGIGSPGARGAGHFYAVGGAWNDTTATSACPSATPVVDDVVTISNGTNFVAEKKWNGSAWVATGVVIDGSLLVSNSVTAAAINTNNLTIRDASGNILFGAGVKLSYASQLAGAPTSLSGINSTEASKLGSVEYYATNGATFGSNIWGQITSSNASTYIASAAIGDALIGNLAASKILAGTLAAGVVYAGSLSADQINAGSLNADRIRGGSGRFQVSAAGDVTIAFANLVRCEASNSDAPYYPAFSAKGSNSSFSTEGAAIEADGRLANAIKITGGANGIAQSGGGGNFFRGVHPSDDNSHSLGVSGNYRWTALYATSSTITTSDARTKTSIENSDLGMDFIKGLRPVKYKQVVAENVVQDNYVELQPEIWVTDDFGVLIKVQSEIIENRPTVTPRPGHRFHYGFIAQEVKQALDQHGAGDAAIWSLSDKDDPDSQQALRYEELIPVAIKALQQAEARITQLELRVAELEAG